MRVLEDVAVESLEGLGVGGALHVIGQLPPGHLWAVDGVEEPP